MWKARKHFTLNISCVLFGTEFNLQVFVLKSSFAAFCAFTQAARTAQATSDPDLLCLCNRTVIPRQTPRHLLENK